MKRRLIPHVSIYLLVALCLVGFMTPFVWMLLASFKTKTEILSVAGLFRFTPTLENYYSVFVEHKFLKYTMNSLIVATGSTLGGLLIGLPAAYAVAKYQMNKISLIVLIVKIVPGIAFLVPWFIIFSRLHINDSYLALIIVHCLIGLPFIVWIMIPFFRTLPNEIEEAGLIDGCTEIGVFRRIILPISTPGYVTAALLAFLQSWNNFLLSLILSGEKTKTLPVAVINFMSDMEIEWGNLMAAASLITVPVLIISLFAQRHIISGMSAGAVKG